MQRKWVKRMILATLFLGGGALFPAGQQALAQDEAATTGRSYAVLMGDEDVTLSGYKTSNVYLWKHEKKAPDQLIGGSVTVSSASLQNSGDKARITLVTDSDGLNLSNDAQVKQVLGALADKLTYTAYTKGEKNLEGTAEIYEGLTFASASKKLSALDFDETTGKAKLAGEVKTPYSGVLGGDDEYEKRGIKQADGTYRFQEDAVIHPGFNITKDDNYLRDFASVMIGKDTTIDMTGHNLDVIMHGNIYNGGGFTNRAAALYVPGSATLTINNPGQIRLDTDSDYYYYADIGAMTENSHVVIHNDDDPDHAVVMRVTTPLKGYEMNVTALKTMAGTIDIDGLVDIYTNGGWATNAASGRISVGGGTIVTQAYNSVTARSGGVMNVNVSGTVEKGLTPGNHTVNITAKGATDWDRNSYAALASMGAWVGADTNATVNAALTTADSTLYGTIQEAVNTKDTDVDGVRLFLQNGAQWTNTGSSSMRHLYGGKDASHVGYIDMSKPANSNVNSDLTIANYTGNTVIYYSQNRGKIQGGNIHIGHAEKTDGEKASITIRTDSARIKPANLANESYMRNMLNTLANKLYYAAYADGENNLKGTVQIAEGLTSQSVSREEDIHFTKAGTGYVDGFQQKATDFTQALTGIMEKDGPYVDANVLRAGNKATFTEDTRITVKDEAAMQAKDKASLTITAKYTDFNLTASGVEGKGIEASGATLNMSNPGNIEINANTGIEASYADDTKGNINLNGSTANLTIHQAKTGVLASGNAETNKGSTIYILNAEGTTTIHNELQDTDFVGMKTTHGSTITTAGRIDIDAGKGTAIHGRVSANGATIRTDGGTAIIVADGTDEDYGGRLSLNSYNSGSKATAADITIDAGDGFAVDATRGVWHIGSQSGRSDTANGIVNVTGHIKLGKEHGQLVLTKGGSVWTGTTVDSTEDGSGSLDLAMEKDAIWNHIDKEGDTGSAVKVFLYGTGYKGDAGDQSTIFQKSKKDIELTDFNRFDGILRVVYNHETENPAAIIGGNIIVDKVSTRYVGGKATLYAVTDHDGISMDDTDQVGSVLKALAKKVIYTNPSEAKLVGKVGIADGLTAKSAMLTEGFIHFDPESGVGSYIPQMVDTFTRSMTGDEVYDQIYTDQGVRQSQFLYSLGKDTTITADKAMDWKVNSNSDVVQIVGQGHTLNLEGQTAGIYIGNDGKNTKKSTNLKFTEMPSLNIAASANGTGILVKNSSASIKMPKDGQMHIASKGGDKDFVGIKVVEDRDTEDQFFGETSFSVGFEGAVDIETPEGIALWLDGGKDLSLLSSANVIHAEGGTLLKVTKSQNNSRVSITGKKLVGDLDLLGATGGTYRITLNNGATWTGGIVNDAAKSGAISLDLWNDQYSITPTLWTYQWEQKDKAQDSYIHTVEGWNPGIGESAIYMKADTNLTIGMLKRGIRILYDHDVSHPTQILGGNVTIEEAEKVNPQTTLYVRTDSDGIDMSDETQVSDVLHALAQKIYYKGTPEYLDSYAEIAEGLTSASVLKTGKITYDETTHQGSLSGTVETPSQDGTLFVTSLYAPKRTGKDENNTAYANAGVQQNGKYFIFRKDSKIQISQSGEVPYTSAIDASSDTWGYVDIKMDLTNHQLDVHIDGGEEGLNEAVAGIKGVGYGVSAQNGTLHIEAANARGDAIGVQTKGKSETASIIDLKTLTHIDAKTGFDVTGGTVRVNAGTIHADTLGRVGANGILSIGNTGDAPAVWTGNMSQSDGQLDMNLDGEDSIWTGAMDWTGGSNSLMLMNGATWKNTGDSHVGQLVSGITRSVGGVIDMTGDSGNIQIDKFSGNASILYKHDANDLTKVSGGDVTVTSAEAGSRITLITDRDGISDDGLREKETVSSLFQTMANKLFYTNYQTEGNLTGILQISEGLTARAASKVTGAMEFTGANGQGQYKADSATPSIYPKDQQKETFTTVMTGNESTDSEYLDGGVMKVGNPSDIRYEFTKDKTAVELATASDTAIQAKDTDYSIDMKGHDLTIKNEGNAGITVDGKALTFRNGKTTELTADKVGIEAKNGGTFRTHEGGVWNISAETAAKADGAGSSVSLGAGKIQSTTLAEASNGGTISFFAPNDTAATEYVGDVKVNDADSKVTLGIATKGSTWTGGLTNHGGTFEMGLQNGGVWNNTGKEEANISLLDATDTGNGVIFQNKDSGGITVDRFRGHALVLYSHSAADPTDILGGDVTVKKADANSFLTLRTDRSGINMGDYHGVENVLAALAKKLTYTDAVNGVSNLNGRVEIAEGLTAASAAKQYGTIDFNKTTGQGSYKKNSMKPGEKDPDIIWGSSETMMMRGAKNAMNTSMLSWRSNVSDMTTRMGDLHYGADDGIWARTFGGKIKYDKGTSSFSNSFWGAQVGADKLFKNGWHFGGAFDYSKGSAKYEMGGEGDPKLYTFSLYGTKLFEDGQYVDIAVKAGHTTNSYTVYNDMGHKLDGDYSANGFGISAEYGKRFGGADGFVEPQLQLTLSRLGSADYDGISDYTGGKKMHVSQDGMTSFIGRLGVAAGKTTERGNFYLKAGLLHEFSGKTSTTFSAENEPTSTVDQDFGDTWAELTLGGTYRLSPSSMLYGDITKSFGGDYKVQWKANVGVRFTF